MHHSRRKSGHGSANTSMTDVRKAAVTASDASRHKRPSATSRRSGGPQTSPKPSRSSVARDSQWQDDRYWDDDRDSFPQYCMTCEKQFVSQDEKSSYCSESCRKVDQNPSSKSTSRSHSSSNQASHYPFYAAGNPEPRDIIPRASPSRPNSMHYSSPPTTPGTQHHGGHSSYYQQQQQQSAISALRSLTIHQPPSPPSPSSGAGVWPFTRSAATSPSNSYTRGTSGFFSSTYDAGYGANSTYNYSSSGMERPLPSRRPGAYSRPKSIELVTPMVGR